MSSTIHDLANEQPEIGSVQSSLTGMKVNRFLHIAENAIDLVNQNKMQRKLGQLTAYLLSTLCWDGCPKLAIFYYV